MSTTGGSSVESFYQEGSSFPSVTGFMTGDKTVTFDYRYETNTSIFAQNELRFVAFSSSGRRLVDQVLATDTTGGFRTASIYLPANLEQFQWIDSNSGPGVRAWVDNLRIAEGNQAGNQGQGGGRFEASSLSQAVDNTDFNFVTGSPNFVPQESESRVGGDAARSGRISGRGRTEMAVELQCPLEVAFYWKVSSEPGRDFLSVAIHDGLFRPTRTSKRISGDKDWALETIDVPSGIHYVVWSYYKDATGNVGDDAGWVDFVQIGRNINPVAPVPDKPVVTPPIMLLLGDDD